MRIRQSRRDFLASLSAARRRWRILGAGRSSLADEGPPETTTIRVRDNRASASRPSTSPRICCARRASPISATYRAAAGPSDGSHVATSTSTYTFAAWVVHLDAGEPITALAGVHPGCFELFAHEPIRTIRDLKGKRVGIHAWATAPPRISLDHGGACRARPPGTSSGSCPDRKRHGAVRRRQDRCLSRLSARAAGAARPQDRSHDPQHATDKPWSQYFCCMAFGNREFVRDHPIATKRALRAILKATDICATEPERAAQRLVDGGFTSATTTRSRR